MMGNTNIFTLCSREQAINLRAVRISWTWSCWHATRHLVLSSHFCLPHPHSGTALTLKSGSKLWIRCRRGAY